MATYGNDTITGISNTIEEDDLKISNAGSNGQFLQKQSGNTGGLTWATVTTTPTTTRGDIIRRGASADERLAKGTNGHVLTMGADDPAWAAIPAATGTVIAVYRDATKSETNTTTVDTWTDSDISIALTPAAAAYKFLCIWDCHALLTSDSVDSNAWGKVRLRRDTTVLSEGHGGTCSPTVNNGGIIGFGGTSWDHPNTTSSVTYKLQFYLNSNHAGNNMTFNWSAWGFTGSTANEGGGNLTILEFKQ